ncbi:Type 1 glutamine amidotransferase-like domain-containing protein [Clostridium tagluense]|uniref:Type 1 glutamine amidotransferase-like domain-containing protein n=1 Tax=Clostridium tagluense TaxID=360422 RepID=UPI001CF447A5|nr:Type 1 glutamine amidotransferase-like domain-containing protein [Clostridium tagluense]MCB2297413.1 Type 1 glutamine amidotransferase-like domain-containing protein [Clostridium tagluense]
MGTLVLFSDFTENDNIDFKNSVRKLFLDKKYILTYIASMTDIELKYYKMNKESLSEYGDFEFHYLDIDEFYNPDNIEELFKSDVIYLSGGNTYYFLNNLKKRNLIDRLRVYVQNGGCIFGLSAGAIMMSKDIGVSQFGDENIAGLTDLSSLDLVEFDFMPHWNQDSSYLNDLKEYTKNTERTCYVCNDGDGIIVKDNEIKFYGNIKIIESGRFNDISERKLQLL